jgi:preprotein translocase subunit SecD
MKRSWWYRFTFLLVVTCMAIMFVIPTFFDFKENSSYPVKSKISLGLDLQGGLYMILGIDFNKVYKDEVRSYARKIEYLLKDQGIESKVGELVESEEGDPRHSIVLTRPTDVEMAKDKIREYFPSVIRMTNENGTTLEYGLTKITKTNIEEQSVSKSIEVIRNRIDEFGVSEPEIVSQGNDRIIVALPGVKDIDRAKELIGKTAKLEFKMVNDEVPLVTIQGWVDKAKKDGIDFKKGNRFSDYLATLNNYLKKDLPAGYEMAFEKTVSKFNNEVESMMPYLVESNPRLTGDQLADARVQIDQQKNEPYVSLDFKTQGAKIFEELTGANVGKRMAIILDGNVYSAPNILTRIAGGRAQITLGGGGFNKVMKEARDLALVLRAGALPVQLDFLEQRTVGPSLGQDSIQKAELASLVGALAVFLFILIYYKLSGMIAIVTLALNVLFVLASLVGLEATLTLPGIAGIALTVGMAIDANIIIYERIREEVRKGLTNYKAVEGGFQHAFWTIIDANITTALAGLCLLNFGTGPIRGFAVTLLIGIVATIYTSYFVGRMLFEFYMDKVEGQELSI